MVSYSWDRASTSDMSASTSDSFVAKSVRAVTARCSAVPSFTNAACHFASTLSSSLAAAAPPPLAAPAAAAAAAAPAAPPAASLFFLRLVSCSSNPFARSIAASSAARARATSPSFALFACSSSTHARTHARAHAQQQHTSTAAAVCVRESGIAESAERVHAHTHTQRLKGRTTNCRALLLQTPLLVVAPHSPPLVFVSLPRPSLRPPPLRAASHLTHSFALRHVSAA